MTRECPACSTKTDDSGRFCPACGAVLVDDAAAVTASLDPGADGATRTSPAASLIGTSVDGFTIEAILGGGAFGTVFRGRQVGLDRPVAIKVPTHEIALDPVMARRFAREARSAARITHPGVVAIYAVGELKDGRPYLAMQLIEGDPLDKILVEGPIPPIRALKIGRDVASALSETHAADVVHRDLKPSNIMWRRDRNGDDRITLVDFGIAIANPGNADATRLTTNGLIGTPHYMSPEQAHGEIADARADLYALGCILFELVTGKPPFEGSGFEVLLAHLGRPIPAPSDRNPDVPEAVDRLVIQLLAKKPDDRPQSADEVVALIDEAVAQLEGRRPAGDSASRTTRAKRKTAQATTLERPMPRPRPKARWIGIGSLALIALCAAGFTVFKLSRGGAAALTGTSDEPTIEDEPGAPSPFTGRREVVSDDGEMTTRVTLYDPIVAGTRVRTGLEVWNAIGAPIKVPNLVITIEDPEGNATGTTAPISKRAPGRFGFWHVFPKPGHYKMRVFPPEATSVFTIDVDVE
ncbi:MAG: serine/threonine protein kinase with repeat [Myxococcales bacterium]|nr:serine/threonine protein kinase with repeat [Myxococcales bacterium]